MPKLLPQYVYTHPDLVSGCRRRLQRYAVSHHVETVGGLPWMLAVREIAPAVTWRCGQWVWPGYQIKKMD